MTQPTIINTIQKIEINNVGSVVVTPVAIDSSGAYVREVRVFGVIDADNDTAPQVLTLRLSSSTTANVTVTAPSQNF